MYGASLSETCAGCAFTELAYTAPGRRYNFKTPLPCTVSVSQTTMRCAVGPGVGAKHTWMIFVGGQAPPPTNQPLTSRPPQMF